MTEEEKRTFFEKILAIGGHDCRVDDMLVVPFHLIPDLVSRASVFLHKGEAFITRRECFSVLLTLYREHLETVMDRTRLELPNIPDDRIPPLLLAIRNAHAHLALSSSLNTKSSDLGSLTVGDVEAVSTHFPPCMQHLYSTLKQTRHLKYHGRQQLSLFLKSINLPLSEAMLFWRRSFKVSDDVFNKEYAYNVRHNYGQEGKRANYGCPPCTKMISTLPNVGAGEVHGCPFRYLKGEAGGEAGGALGRLLMEKYGLDAMEVQIIGEEVKSGHFQVACTKSLEYRTGMDHEETITSPVQFYEASLKQFLKNNNNSSN